MNNDFPNKWVKSGLENITTQRLNNVKTLHGEYVLCLCEPMRVWTGTWLSKNGQQCRWGEKFGAYRWILNGCLQPRWVLETRSCLASFEVDWGSLGWPRRVFLFPETIKTPWLWVGDTDGATGKCQMGKQRVSLSPSFLRSYFPELFHAASQGAGAWHTACSWNSLWHCSWLPCPMEWNLQATEVVGGASKLYVRGGDCPHLLWHLAFL